MAEFNPNVWAPWRMAYIDSLGGSGNGCFLCEHVRNPAADQTNHVLWRSPNTLVLLNRFPYSSGHLLIAPTAHQGELEELPDAVLCEMFLRTRDAKRVLQQALAPQGFNIGLNLGRCAGAGLPEHVHLHIVPRWAGDTNFLPVLADIQVIPEAIDRTFAKLGQAAKELGLHSSDG
jgi:ATP adenylyltransferase